MKWHGKRAGFVISASLISAVTISLIFVFFLKTELNGKPVVFTYHLESYSQQRYLTVNVDLSDGMNQSESVQVADALFDDCMGQYQHEVVSANMTAQGIWIVQLSWDYGHWFRATIDPSNRTIVYTHCK
ncbi:MAG: hypothetical protein ABR962_05535 [Candidatus Bathyarchaeia archaeon]|jgi:hypothetical protein